MGIRLWRAKNYSPMRIEVELARTSARLGRRLTPTPEMDDHYRSSTPTTGRSSTTATPATTCWCRRTPAGSARNPRPAGHRAGPDAVLYAPTWRDDLATNFRGAPLVTHLDVERPRPRSGADYVMLMRGHRFHAARRASGRPRARRVDVPRDQRPDPRLGRRGARLLLAALRLRAHGAADGLPGAGPGHLHRRRSAASSTRSTESAPGPLVGDHRRGDRPAARPRRAAGGHRRDLARVQRDLTTACRTVGAAASVVDALLGGAGAPG